MDDRKIATIVSRLLLALFAAVLAGCVGTQVKSLNSTSGNVALERVLIVYRPGSFGRDGVPMNSAESLGNRNLGQLVSHLYARLPLAFQAQGVQARMVSEADMRTTRVEPGEKLLWLQPETASYSSRGGQTLFMLADLVDPATRQSLWRGQVRMGTPGFGKFDDGVADSIGSQIVQQLQTAHVVVMPGVPLPSTAAGPAPAGSPQVTVAAREPAPAAAGAPRPAAAATSAPPRGASGFAAIDDVDAIPYLNDRGRQGYREWLRRGTPRAFALSTDGHWYSTTGLTPPDTSLPKDPAERALLMCERAAHRPCKLYAVNGAVVWRKD